MNTSRKGFDSAARFHFLSLLGLTVFAVAVSVPSPADSAVPHATIVLSNSPAPGFPSGALFQELSAPILNNAGFASFGAFIPLGSGIDSFNNFGYWVAAENGLQLRFRTGSPAPGTLQGINFESESVFAHTVDDLGRVGFAWSLNDGTKGVWGGTARYLPLLARDGATTPIMSDVYSWAQPTGSFSATHVLADVIAYQTNGGTVILGGAKAGSFELQEVLWRGQSSNLGLIARSGGSVPGYSNTVFDRISKLAVSPNGRVAFFASLRYSTADFG